MTPFKNALCMNCTHKYELHSGATHHPTACNRYDCDCKFFHIALVNTNAGVVKQADTEDLKSSGETLGGSNPSAGTNSLYRDNKIKERREAKRRMITYLELKLREEDWHGVQDAASDLRDIDSELKGLEF